MGVTESVLVGFDAREKIVHAWDGPRRERYLLVADTSKPYSVDVLVWPNVFGDGMVGAETPETRARLIPAPSWRGPNAPLWEDLACLRTAISSVPHGDYTLVAVSQIRTRPFSGEIADEGGFEPTRDPTTLDAHWSLLGYDVADRFLLSGLMNCGYAAESKPELASRWGPRLNSHHLFVDIGDAVLFAAETERRVAAHAPFFVFSLHAYRRAP